MTTDYIKLISALKKVNRRRLDDLFHESHHAVFDEFDCLSCANCCKSIPPRLTEADIRRISKHLKLKPAVFWEKYLRADEDGDQVFNTSPCPFLDTNNYCLIYDHRPLACAGYPHTDRPRMYQILDVTRKNAEICPAVRIILEKISSL